MYWRRGADVPSTSGTLGGNIRSRMGSSRCSSPTLSINLFLRVVRRVTTTTTGYFIVLMPEVLRPVERPFRALERRHEHGNCPCRFYWNSRAHTFGTP